MGEPHIISALKSKRAEIAGVVAELEKELAERRVVLEHAGREPKPTAPWLGFLLQDDLPVAPPTVK